MQDSILILTQHAAATLPDSIAARRRVLAAMLRVLKSSHRAYAHVAKQLAALETMEQLQAQLPLQFTEAKP